MDEAAAPKFDPIRHRRGGRPRKPPQERRSIMFKVRVTQAEREQIKAKAAAVGLSLSEYGRLVFTGEKHTIRIAPIPPPEVTEALREMGRNLWEALENGRRRGWGEAEQRALMETTEAIRDGLGPLLADIPKGPLNCSDLEDELDARRHRRTRTTKASG